MDESKQPEVRKKEIQKLFKEKTGLIIDKPKPGFGISHDGNTARRFFQDHQLTSEITGIDVEIIERFSNLLAAISCNRVVDFKKYEKYGIATAQLFLDTYPSFTFSPTVHKILFHGHEYIQHFRSVPLGKLYLSRQRIRKL